MKLTFLGTGTSQGVPIIGCNCAVCMSEDPHDRRLRPSIMLTTEGGKNLVVDAGPDFRYQLLREKVLDIAAILYTHEHNDHIIGLDDVRPLNYIHQKNMPLYVSDAVAKALRERFAYVFAANPYPGAPMLTIHHIEQTQAFCIKEMDDLEVLPIAVWHGKMPILGFRFGDLTYITDCKTLDQTEIEKIKGSKILILNALHHEEHIAHLNLKEAIELAQAINAPITYFTHMSHRMGKHSEMKHTLPPNIHFAYDGLVLSF